MKNLLPFLGLLLLGACNHDFTHERYIENASLDTFTVFNPDFKETVYTLYPGDKKLIYTFKNLDTQQEKEPCKWLGDTLIIKTIHDSICTKPTSIEANWVSKLGGTEKARKQTCTFTIYVGDFD